ncbi:hypothetical protein AB3S75_020171 [Citrus x aurantiifolia]
MAKALSVLNLPTDVVPRRNHSRPSLPYRPMMVTMAMSTSNKNKSYWTSVHEDIGAHLRQAVVVKEPVEVYEPMRHFVFAAPVNMAPALCVAACELVGGYREQAIVAAAALHVMHAASFIHENLPLSDRPSLIPKSKPTMYHAFKPNTELLVADAMLPFGLELLASSDNPAGNNSGGILRVMVEMTRAMGSQGVVEGQYNELQCDDDDGDGDDRKLNGITDVEMTYETYKKEEGRLHACGAACGAILGGGSEEEIELLRRYGFYVGRIQGIVSRRLGPKEEIEELKKLAFRLREVKSFNDENAEVIFSLVDDNITHVLGSNLG